MITSMRRLHMFVLVWSFVRTKHSTCAFSHETSIHQNYIDSYNASKSALYHHPTTQRHDKKYMNYGMLISSFSEGILGSISDTKKKRESQEFLKYSLYSLIIMDIRKDLEEKVESSAKYSPCTGPNIDYLNSMEELDVILNSSLNKGFSRNEKMNVMKRFMAPYLGRNQNAFRFNLNLLYIPTAMYALRSDSQNSPGKQRQRARADGKSRRDEIVLFLKNFLSRDMNLDESVSISAVTLDLDDGSIKQPYTSNPDLNHYFPTDGKEALTTWNPHIIYVEGGNTFWLWHCIEKGCWQRLIIDACCVEKDELRRPALYIGKSAGAIVAGKYVETACWKGWDDPSIVLNRKEYSDWTNCLGLNMAGGSSFFPHMNDEWNDLVEEKMSEMGFHRDRDFDHDHGLFAMRDTDTCCVEAATKQIHMVN